MAKLYIFALAVLFACGSVIGQNDTTLAPVPDTTLPPEPPTEAPTEPPTEPPTEAPATTTVEPEPETTLPPEPETTTAAPVPDTTTAPIPVTTPAPEADYNYNITENNVTCIMIEGDVSFMVNYTTDNSTQTATITLPKHPMASTLISGTCNGTDGQEKISITWGSTEQSNSVNLEFNQKEDTWSISSFTANLFMDPKIFANGTDAGKTLSLVVDYGFSPLSVPVNHSYNCHSSLSAVNITATIGEEPYALGVSSKLDGIHIQAFNMVPNEPDFVSSVHCSADEISDVVPIAVGCALAALVVIVLIAYLVGRRRRSAAYQSV